MSYDRDREIPRANLTFPEPFYLAVVQAIEAQVAEYLPKAEIEYTNCSGCGALHAYVLPGEDEDVEDPDEPYFDFHIPAGKWRETS